MNKKLRINPNNPLEKLLCDALNWRYDQQDSCPCWTNLSGTDFEPYIQYAIVLGKDGHFTLAPMGDSGGTTWGQITGDIKNQNDLWKELDDKQKEIISLATQFNNFQAEQKTENKLLEKAISDLKDNKQDKIDFSPKHIDISQNNLPPTITNDGVCIFSEITQIGKIRAKLICSQDFLCLKGTPIFSNIPNLKGADQNVDYWYITDINGKVLVGLGFNEEYGESVLINNTDCQFVNGTTYYVDGVGIWPPYKK